MTAPARTRSRPQRPRPLSAAPSLSAPDGLGTLQFQVVAANIADAVQSIGGLIYDRAMAGWQVSVVVDADGDGDARALRILGARTSAWLPSPHLLAVATDVMVTSDAVRRQVLDVGDDTAVLLWGRHHPTNLGRRFIAVRHQPSSAAHLFKSQALIAVGAPPIGRADEGLYSIA